MAKMTITRGLAELKMLDKQIANMTSAGEFLGTKRKNQKHINNKDLEIAKKEFASLLQEIRDKIAYRQRLKAAIVQANATTEVTIAGKTYTIAQAIDLKKSLSHEKQLRTVLARQYTNLKEQVERHNTAAAQQAEREASAAFGSKQKSSTEEYAQYVEEYKNRQEIELVEGFDVMEVVKELDVFLSEFFTEVDFVLSEANATTHIEV